MTAETRTDRAAAQDFISYLPDRVWYLTSSGTDMWCRRPYGFVFTTADAAEAFARSMGTAFELTAIGVASRDLLSEDGIAALRGLQVTRVFIDPRTDPTTGEVFGAILRMEPMQ